MDEAWVRKQEAEYEEADVVIVPSTFVRDTLCQRGIPEAKIAIVRHGVDIDRFPYQRLAPHPGPLRIISVGAVSLEKGVPYLLEACRRLGPKVSLTLIGQPFPEMRALLQKSRTQFRHIARVPNARLSEVLHAHDVFVLASVQDGSAMAVLEAMATGRPAIVSDHNGARDFVVDGTGYVVPSRNAAALAEAIEKIVADRSRLPEMGLAAHDAVKNYTWTRYGAQLVELYHSAVDGSDPLRPPVVAA
jgi:glycosyltransferase involved in cell wall biosynthesis